jgi:hypothetical protein
MTPTTIAKCREDFMAERIAIMIHDAGLPEDDAKAWAEICWWQYCLQYGIDNERDQ